MRDLAPTTHSLRAASRRVAAERSSSQMMERRRQNVQSVAPARRRWGWAHRTRDSSCRQLVFHSEGKSSRGSLSTRSSARYYGWSADRQETWLQKTVTATRCAKVDPWKSAAA